MALIEWKPRMSVGVSALDDDHRKLFDLLNQLHDVVRGTAERDEVVSIVADLVAYTEYHFECEERLMRLGRYPGLEDHTRIHRDMRRRMVSFQQKFLDAPTDANVLALYDYVSDWLVRHILGEDMRYRPYLDREGKAKGDGEGDGAVAVGMKPQP